jgi:RimK-like ATP-grasp domain
VILLWGLPSDEPMAAVADELGAIGAPMAFLDQRRVLDTELELSIGEAIGGRLRVGDDELDLAQVSAAYIRPYESLRVPAIQRAGADSVEAGHALSVEDALTSWLDVTPAFVVNRPSAMASNTSKPYQSELISRHGFATPTTLITTDRQAVVDFAAEHGRVIYKSISSTRSIVHQLDISDVDRLEDVRWCPTQFQGYVNGEDVRVHVIGDEVYACVIESGSDDYRYASGEGAARIRSCFLPDEVGVRCRGLARTLELPVAGIDLRHSPDGTWYCFEVNPAPGFSYFQKATAQPMGQAIARLLLSTAQ